MGKLSFWESVRVWLGGVAFDVFLWSVRMSADDYFDMIQTEGGLTKREPDDGDAPAESELSNDELDTDYQLWSNM